MDTNSAKVKIMDENRTCKQNIWAKTGESGLTYVVKINNTKVMINKLSKICVNILGMKLNIILMYLINDF